MPTVSAPKQATTEAAASSASANRLADALAAGKFEEGSSTTDVSAGTASTPELRTVEVSGHGASSDALLAGKLTEGFGPNANVQYVRGPGEATGGLTQELATIDPEAPATPAVSAPQFRTVEVAGQGSSHDALIAGKFTEDFGRNPYVRYTSALQTVRGGLWQALDDGKLDDSNSAAQPSIAPVYSSSISGGPQE